MKATVLEIPTNSSGIIKGLDTNLSFTRFIEFVRARISEETTIKKRFFEFVLERLLAEPRFSGPISLNEVEEFDEQLSLIYSIMLPAVANEKDTLWALSTPLDPTIFYGTSALYDVITDSQTGRLKCDIVKEEENPVTVKQKMQVLYSLILNRLYGFDLHFYSDMTMSFVNESTGLTNYFRVNLDTSFIDVTAKGPLPEITFESVQSSENINWIEIANLLPLQSLHFEGFSIITLTDITADHTVETIKNVILERAKADSKGYFKHISQSLKTLAGNTNIEFGLLPVLRINSRVVFNNESYAHSMVMKHAFENGMEEEEFQKMAEGYFRAPKLFLITDTSDPGLPKDHFLELLINNDVKSYALLPVYYSGHISGVLEVYTKRPNLLNEQILSKLDVALPLIAQLLQNNIDDFDSRIENIITEKFTSIQPSVQWKFKEVAWHYLRDNTVKLKKMPIESIQFKNVFPLYGAIDIRNSTIERNKALSDDLVVQFEALIDTLNALKGCFGLGLFDEMIYKCEKWIKKINNHTIDHEEMKVKEFFESEVDPFLKHFKESCPEVTDVVKAYEEVVNEHTGAAFANRRALEASMQKINSALNMYLDLFKNQIQESYPCYFEKFRTDGVEYDIYIGQSIAPEKVFNNLYLKNIRLWQLTSMAAIARITTSLLPSMEKPLETTQLIFINHGSIDISFRDDERRFDVEGAYNIRYHVIKKRIDKVRIANTHERLTQPGKIAMVYFNAKEADEYVEYIRYLQEEGMLTDDLEYLDLEELQGVTGLRALRVGINLEGIWKPSLENALFENQVAV